MVTLTRRFYHKIRGITALYHTEVSYFGNMIQARNFCYQLYRHKYNTYEIPFQNPPVIVYANALCQIDCYFEESEGGKN